MLGLAQRLKAPFKGLHRGATLYTGKLGKLGTVSGYSWSRNRGFEVEVRWHVYRGEDITYLYTFDEARELRRAYKEDYDCYF